MELIPSIVAVPARLESARLPNKVMADIGGKPMLRHVLERSRLARHQIAVVLCTDSTFLAARAKEWGFPVLLTESSCRSGSDRLASVVDQLLSLANLSESESLIINVQGDQPFIDPQIIEQMTVEFSTRSPMPEVLTPVYSLSADRIHNPNVVKTLLTSNGKAIYFSRSALPHVRDKQPEDWSEQADYWGHVGIYGYRSDVLRRWNKLPDSPLEQAEKLEQLRLIDAGIAIGTFPVQAESLSVDTVEQLEQARQIASMQPQGYPADRNFF